MSQSNIISRADARRISSAQASEILKEFGVADLRLIGEGTEAKVYQLDSDHVLKLYADASRINMLRDLKGFYDSLDSSMLDFALPKIYQIKPYDEILAIVERFIPGGPMSDILPARDTPNVRALYVAAVAELGKVKLQKPLGRFMLFDSSGHSVDRTLNWHSFLSRLVHNKLALVADHLEQDVSDFATKVDSLSRHLAKPYSGPMGIIHGDLYPGNMLLSASSLVTGIIDFGTFTMVGDPLFDAATSWGFYNMYEPNHVEVRSNLLDVVVAHYGPAILPALYRYLLIYAIISCDLYPEETGTIRDTGHYQWAVEILRTPEYWGGLD